MVGDQEAQPTCHASSQSWSHFHDADYRCLRLGPMVVFFFYAQRCTLPHLLAAATRLEMYRTAGSTHRHSVGFAFSFRSDDTSLKNIDQWNKGVSYVINISQKMKRFGCGLCITLTNRFSIGRSSGIHDPSDASTVCLLGPCESHFDKPT